MNNYNDLNIPLSSKSVCLIAHIDPDADAISSMVVFRDFLKKHFKINKVDIYAETKKLSSNLLPILDKIKINNKISKYETAIMMDSPNLERLGIYKQLFENANNKIVIDHHATNNYKGDINIVENCSSTCEIIYSILKYFKFPISKENQGKLYAGIITDTNNFCVGNITDRTFKIASEFNSNIDKNAIYNHFFQNNSLKNMQLLSLAVQNITTFDHGRIIITHISHEEALKYKAETQDYIGITNRIAAINSASLICFIEPREDFYYVSMRSKRGLDISMLAKKYGGGGHAGAAAFISKNRLREIEQLILLEFRNILKKNKDENKTKSIF